MLRHKDCGGEVVENWSKAYEYENDNGSKTLHPAYRCLKCDGEIVGDAQVILEGYGDVMKQSRFDIIEELDWSPSEAYVMKANDEEPWVVVLPGGATIEFGHHAWSSVDEKRARFVCNAINEKLKRDCE